jgi:tellurite resistance protein
MTAQTAQTESLPTDDTTPRLAHFPVTFFAVVMGLAGFTIALHAATPALGLPPVLAEGAYVAALAAFAVIAALYAVKALRHPGSVRAEWNHPVKIAFFPAISISILLLATATLPRNAAIADIAWLAGAGLQAGLTLAVISSWISHRAFQHGVLSPAWFIPAVGNVIAPIAGAQLGHVELSWYFMSVGLIFWVVLLTLVFNRLVFHDPLPGKLQPTLVILIAPPAVAFLAWMQLVGEAGAFGRVLLNGAYFFTLIVAVQMPRLLRLPFAMSFWALSFPFAAVTIASLVYARAESSPAHLVIGAGLLVVLTAIIAGLAWRTVKAVLNREICLPE